MKIVDSVVSASVPRVSVIRNVSLREKVHNVASNVYDRGPDNADVIGNICAGNVGLQEWRMNLSRVEQIARLGI